MTAAPGAAPGHPPTPDVATGGDAPPVRELLGSTRVVLVVFVVLTALATNQLFVLSDRTATGFAWTIAPPLTAAFLGAGFAAGFVLVALTLRTRTWAQARLPVVTVLVFASLTLVATCLHLDKFHLHVGGGVARFAGWFWVVIYVLVPVALAWTVVRQVRRPGVDPARRRPLPRALALVLGVQGVVITAAGAALFLGVDGVTAAWPWALTPLTAQAVGAWLVAFGTAAALALWEDDLHRLRTATTAYTVFAVLQLLAVALHAGDLRGDAAATGVYLAVLVSMVVTGAVGWVLGRRTG